MLNSLERSKPNCCPQRRHNEVASSPGYRNGYRWTSYIHYGTFWLWFVFTLEKKSFQPIPSGKTTLLDVLANRMKAKVNGTILVNGDMRNPATFKHQAAYVPQEDALLVDNFTIPI